MPFPPTQLRFLKAFVGLPVPERPSLDGLVPAPPYVMIAPKLKRLRLLAAVLFLLCGCKETSPILKGNGQGIEGGDVMRAYLESARSALVETLSLVRTSPVGSLEQTLCGSETALCQIFLNAKPAEQQAAEAFIRSALDQVLLMHSPGSNRVPFELAEQSIQLTDALGSSRDPDAWTPYGSSGAITFLTSSLNTLTFPQLLAVMTHESLHKVIVNQTSVTDGGAWLSPFDHPNGGYDLLTLSGALIGLFASANAATLPSVAKYVPPDAPPVLIGTANTWHATSSVDAPSARIPAVALWTGSKMLIWGGGTAPTGGAFLSDGALYDPYGDYWTPMSLNGNPFANATDLWWSQITVSGVWTGREMLAWVGIGQRGGRYYPEEDSWGAMSATKGPSPRQYQLTAWTGTEMVIWGGVVGSGSPVAVNTGAAYNPVSDTWRPLSTAGAPSPRAGGCAVWTGSEMIIWGGGTVGYWLSVAAGTTPSPVGGGGRYNPGQDTWAPVSTVGAPKPDLNTSCLWTGSRMAVATSSALATYDPATNSWAPLISSKPFSGFLSLIAQSGMDFLLWSSNNIYQDDTKFVPALATPFLLDPATGGAAGSSSFAPRPLYGQASVWTGRQMIVWGGMNGASPSVAGAVYTN